MNFKLLTATTLLLTIGITVPAISADKDERLKFKTTRQCVDCNLSEARLYGSDWENANLQGANLFNSEFSSSDLKNVNFSGSNSKSVNFNKSDLRNANF